MKTRVILLATLFTSFSLAAQTSVESKLNDFTTDKCSMFPEGPRDFPQKWEACCVQHDLDYWMGGDAIERKIADLRLKQCVKKNGHSFIAWLMHKGVRIGGYAGYHLGWSWGYGWEGRKDYLELSPEEKLQVLFKLRSTNLVPEEMKSRIISLRLLTFPSNYK